MHKEFFFSPKSLIIDLDNGIYSLGFSGSTGKSYVAQLLGKVSEEEDNVSALVITYNQNLDINGLIKIISQKHFDIIILDRFDLYADSNLCVELYKHKDTSVILLDLKNLNNVTEFVPSVCNIELSKDSIEVAL